MKKFTFRLQTVLDMREKFLEKKQLEMAEIIQMLNVQIDKLDALLVKKTSTKQSLEAIYESDAELDILGISNYKNFLAKMINDMKNQENIINNTKQILRIKQLEVSAALKEVKVLEKLKENQKTKFYKEFELKETKEIDDITNTRYRLNAV